MACAKAKSELKIRKRESDRRTGRGKDGNELKGKNVWFEPFDGISNGILAK